MPPNWRQPIIRHCYIPLISGTCLRIVSLVVVVVLVAAVIVVMVVVVV
jgi:hypothetical protein